jgi:PE-PPE domain
MVFKTFAAALAALVLSASPAQADTFTVEPFDYDGVIWSINITQEAFGGSQCPCQKVAYPADDMPWNNQKGADQIWALVQKGTIKSGSTLMGFSLGVQVISLFMSQHPLPAGVKVLLAGDTFNRNQQLVAAGAGIPWATPNQVTMVANEYDGWSDFPDITAAPGYDLAVENAIMGTQKVHNYVNAQLDNPANLVTVKGNITAILIPNQNLPLGDETKRAEIDAAYTRPAPVITSSRAVSAQVEQVPANVPLIPPQTPEPIAQ